MVAHLENVGRGRHSAFATTLQMKPLVSCIEAGDPNLMQSQSLGMGLLTSSYLTSHVTLTLRTTGERQELAGKPQHMSPRQYEEPWGVFHMEDLWQVPDK